MRLLTITPVHVWSGEILNPLSYVVEKNLLFVLNMEKFFAMLNEPQREKYLQWINPILYKMAELDDKIVQAKNNWDLKRQLQDQKREMERQLSISWFIKNKFLQNPVEFVKRCIAYQVTFSLPLRRGGFNTHIKDIQYRPYIPGTEIKGAIRTSLLYTLLGNKENYEILRKSLSDFRAFFKSGASQKDKVKKMLCKITDAQSEDGLERKLLRGEGKDKKDAKYDLLKLINVSDTNTIPPDRLQISTIRVLGSKRNIKIWLETIKPETEFNFDFRIQEKAFLDILGLERLQAWMSIQNIFKACYYRSKEILKEEESYFKGEKKILEIINRLKNDNQPDSPLLRIGWGQGFLGITLGLKVKQNDPDLYDKAIREGVSFYREWRTLSEKFPKTRRVIVDSEENPETLLGWVKLTTT